MTEQSPEIEDLEINPADVEGVTGGASIGPVHPLVPEVEGVVGKVTAPNPRPMA